MPELPYTEKSIIDASQDFIAKDQEHMVSKGYKFLGNSTILEILKGKNLKFIGAGAECVVVSRTDSSTNVPWWKKIPLINKTDNNLVIAIDYRTIKTPEEAKKIFYAQRIMSILFPNNFPRFASSYSVEEGDVKMSGTVRHEVDISKVAREDHGSDLDKNSKHPFKTVLDTVKELGIPFFFEDSNCNYALGPNKGVYYLDKIIFSNIGEPTRERILQWMTDHNYNEKDITLVNSSIDRLHAIENEKSAVKI